MEAAEAGADIVMLDNFDPEVKKIPKINSTAIDDYRESNVVLF